MSLQNISMLRDGRARFARGGRRLKVFKLDVYFNCFFDFKTKN